MIKKYDFYSPGVVINVIGHPKIKETILNLISESLNSEVNDIESAETYISNTDWKDHSNPERKWVKALVPILSPYISKGCRELGYRSFSIKEIWFQQYEQNSTHGWHIHNGNYTGIYYLELPNNGPITEFVIPGTEKKIFVPEITEGDLFLVPSFVLHRSPPNRSICRKTIVSFNFNLAYPDEFYGEGIGIR